MICWRPSGKWSSIWPLLKRQRRVRSGRVISVVSFAAKQQMSMPSGSSWRMSLFQKWMISQSPRISFRAPVPYWISFRPFEQNLYTFPPSLYFSTSSPLPPRRRYSLQCLFSLQPNYQRPTRLPTSSTDFSRRLLNYTRLIFASCGQRGYRGYRGYLLYYLDYFSSVPLLWPLLACPYFSWAWALAYSFFQALPKKLTFSLEAQATVYLATAGVSLTSFICLTYRPSLESLSYLLLASLSSLESLLSLASLRVSISSLSFLKRILLLASLRLFSQSISLCSLRRRSYYSCAFLLPMLFISLLCRSITRACSLARLSQAYLETYHSSRISYSYFSLTAKSFSLVSQPCLSRSSRSFWILFSAIASSSSSDSGRPYFSTISLTWLAVSSTPGNTQSSCYSSYQKMLLLRTSSFFLQCLGYRPRAPRTVGSDYSSKVELRAGALL